jgi:hypothetical protein
MSPSIAFAPVTSVCRSLVLTSGTLNPMDSFASELGVPFPVRFEGRHVIRDDQLWVGVIVAGPSGVALEATYQAQESFAFQDDLGLVILQAVQSIPNGVLVFLPSYKLIEKLHARWTSTGLLRDLAQVKHIEIEPKSASEFEPALQRYLHSCHPISRASFASSGKSGSGAFAPTITGGLFLAVFRGKLSEGIDFADDAARGVILVGIPYQSVSDLPVLLKKEHNNKMYQQQNSQNARGSVQGVLSGQAWYELQAYRAINQAIGRVIRHKNDFGAVVLVDARLAKPQATQKLSKWVRTVKEAADLRSLDTLPEFFQTWSSPPGGYVAPPPGLKRAKERVDDDGFVRDKNGWTSKISRKRGKRAADDPAGDNGQEGSGKRPKLLETADDISHFFSTYESARETASLADALDSEPLETPAVDLASNISSTSTSSIGDTPSKAGGDKPSTTVTPRLGSQGYGFFNKKRRTSLQPNAPLAPPRVSDAPGLKLESPYFAAAVPSETSSSVEPALANTAQPSRCALMDFYASLNDDVAAEIEPSASWIVETPARVTGAKLVREHSNRSVPSGQATELARGLPVLKTFAGQAGGSNVVELSSDSEGEAFDSRPTSARSNSRLQVAPRARQAGLSRTPRTPAPTNMAKAALPRASGNALSRPSRKEVKSGAGVGPSTGLTRDAELRGVASTPGGGRVWNFA